VTVAAIATDAATGTTLSAQSTFDPIGRYHGLPWPDQTKLLKCLQRIVKFPLDLADLRSAPDQPRPNWRDLVKLVISRAEVLGGMDTGERQTLKNLVAIADRARRPNP